MSRAILSYMYLTGIMMRQGFDELSLSKELGYRTLVPVSRWVNGASLPLPHELPLLAAILQEDVITVAIGWLMAQCPELEGKLRREILEPRGVVYPDTV